MTDTPTRVTKRTISDAIQSLDEACRSRDSLASSNSNSINSKKQRTHPSSTPALEAILARTTPRSIPSSAPPPASYEPTSLSALLARLATYKLTTFSPSKPHALSQLNCALHGWINKGARERLECVTCHRGVVLLPPTAPAGWHSPAGTALKHEYERSVLAPGLAHDSTCPWRMRPCSRGLYKLQGGGGRRKLLQVVATQAQEMHERGLDQIELDLPITVRQLMEEAGANDKLRKSITSVSSQPRTDDDQSTESDASFSSITILLAIFGWTLDPLPVPSSALSLSNSTSSLSSLSATSAPILSCAYCLRQVLTTPYLASTDGTRKLLNPAAQHHSYCPFVDTATNPTTAASSPSNPTTTTTRIPGVVLPRKKPGYQIRLETVLQRPSPFSSYVSGCGHGPNLEPGRGEPTSTLDPEDSPSTTTMTSLHPESATIDQSVPPSPRRRAEVEGGARVGQPQSSTIKTRELLNYVRGLLGPTKKKRISSSSSSSLLLPASSSSSSSASINQ